MRAAVTVTLIVLETPSAAFSVIDAVPTDFAKMRPFSLTAAIFLSLEEYEIFLSVAFSGNTAASI